MQTDRAFSEAFTWIRLKVRLDVSWHTCFFPHCEDSARWAWYSSTSEAFPGIFWKSVLWDQMLTAVILTGRQRRKQPAFHHLFALPSILERNSLNPFNVSEMCSKMCLTWYLFWFQWLKYLERLKEDSNSYGVNPSKLLWQPPFIDPNLANKSNFRGRYNTTWLRLVYNSGSILDAAFSWQNIRTHPDAKESLVSPVCALSALFIKINVENI